MLTITGELAQDWAPDLEDWRSWVPGGLAGVMPGTKFLLIERETGIAHPLKTGLNTIGRFDNNDIVCTEKGISRRHCVIVVHAGGNCELHDTASRNGTYVNDIRVEQPVELKSGVVVRLAKKRFFFVSMDDYLGELKAAEEGEMTLAE
jgi:pSer/pThr/pTyr-binding forkhead associated (FHA) protein